MPSLVGSEMCIRDRCAPCKQLEPELVKLGGEWGEKVRLAKVDVDEYPNLAMKFGVMGVPTLILFMAGQAKQRLTGYQPSQRILEKMGSFLKLSLIHISEPTRLGMISYA